ncbi:MAG: dihydrofolate reductase [bacterium]|jgi:dihydrofolate reductase
MKTKLSVYIATSLDGFIARKDGNLDWLSENDQSQSKEDYGFQPFMDSIDAIVMGRNTFETVLLSGEWPYKNKPVIVLSSKPVKIPTKRTDTVEGSSLPLKELLQQLVERGLKNLYIDGGKTIQGFLQEGLINQITITRIPILLGSGIPLFANLNQDIHVEHLETCTFPTGFVQSTYQVKKQN